MNTLIIIGAVLVVMGIAGSLLPALPGPTLSFLGLVLLYFARPGTVSVWILVVFGVGMIFLFAVNYIAPVLGAKYSGAAKAGVFGAVIGAVAGMVLFPSLGIFFGALIGAFTGEIASDKTPAQALKAGIGTVIGNLAVIILQAIYSAAAAVYFFWKILIS